MEEKFSLDWGGRELKITLNNWAEQANGAVLAQYGETIVMATAVMSREPREGIDFFPLIVDYREKYYAAGKIGGSRFVRREGRPSDEATLTARMIDRALRPRFNQKMRNEVQIVITALSYDQQNDPGILGFIAASCALHLSDIPWEGPVGIARVGKEQEQYVLNPVKDSLEQSVYDIIVAGSADRINMLEAGAKEVKEQEVQEAIEFGFKHIQPVINLQEEIRQKAGKEKQEIYLHEPNEEIRKEMREFTAGRLEEALFREFKQERMDAVNELKKELRYYLEGKYAQERPEYIGEALNLFEEEIDRLVHKRALEQNKRVDGRGLREIRPLGAQTGLLPRVHGSGLFTRGLTHSLSTITLGAPGDEQLLDDMEKETKKRFMHHYNFPPYSTGEAGAIRGPGRREIGHGALAERALEPILPDKEEFPYVIRAVSEILSSNGSTSMAAASSSSLALMDAGVPISGHITGISMGLMTAEDGSYKLLTDIQGPEDHHGDMDFKVAGTRKGITAIQMDVKIKGITTEILKDALQTAKEAREEILSLLEREIEKPRDNISPYAPAIQRVNIDPKKIGMVIGPGGSVINQITTETGANIEIEDDGTVYISSQDTKMTEKAAEWVKSITREIKIGEQFQGRVTKVTDFGAFVEIVPGQEGLVHISELSDQYVKNVEDIVKEGDIIPVKVIKIDEQGKIGLSLKQATNNGGEQQRSTKI